MLSIFPELFTYGLFAPLILRIVLGGYFVLLGIRRVKEDSAGYSALWGNTKIGSKPLAPILAKIQITIGIMIFIGLYTQVIVIVAIAFMLAEWFRRSAMGKLSFQELWNTLLIVAICAALLILGAGLLAFDLPL